VKEALIVLSLLGCDDAGSQCHFLRTIEDRFETVEACRDASEVHLQGSAQEDYPTVVAMCSAEFDMARQPVAPEAPAEDSLQPPPEVAAEAGFLKRLGGAVASALPDRETVEKPAVIATEGAIRVGSAVIVGISRAADAVNPF
jgi:hypothetical protein